MFSETLKELRKTHGLTQAQMAQVMGVNLRTYQYYERGEHIPQDPVVLQRVAARFDVPIHTLVNSSVFYRMLRAESHVNDKEADRIELFRIIEELTTLFAGGNLSETDRELFLEAVSDLARESHD